METWSHGGIDQGDVDCGGVTRVGRGSSVHKWREEARF